MKAETEKLISELPDRPAVRRFLDSLVEKHPDAYAKLEKNAALLSDVATLVAFSPLLAATLLQNPDYLWWLNRERAGTAVKSKEELMEALARFSLTNSQLAPQILFARFRRRELLRIYLRDIRRLATIAEITEEISNLADAILEYALKLAAREMDNRFGTPLETDEKGRSLIASFCIVALGKLGSRELNYSSDIDLIFLYSNEGNTSGRGTRDAVTNREYFVKLAEYIVKLIGEPSGEGAAYRVDVRLRPHGTLGALALSVNDAVRYYETEARGWERQVMIRSRACAGNGDLYKRFFASVEDLVFSTGETVESALTNVRTSKEKIDSENIERRGFNVKLGSGGIREIEFIAQALQLAYGGSDTWLRSPHTLITIARLADRRHISESELSQLSSAYEFLRRTEHVLQMENGVQTHTVPDEPEKRDLLARRVTFAAGGDFEHDLQSCSSSVRSIFARVFGDIDTQAANDIDISKVPTEGERTRSHLLASLEKSTTAFAPAHHSAIVVDRLAEVSPHFSAMLAANPRLAVRLPDMNEPFAEPNYRSLLIGAVEAETNLRRRLSALRQAWAPLLLEIAVRDVFQAISIEDAKRLQTALGEASIEAALRIVRDELNVRYGVGSHAPLAVLALGKLGGRGLDYGSDMDLVLVYDEKLPVPEGETHAEFYGRAVELFVTTLSAMTRDGNLYRVDLRLRPYGSKGLSSMPGGAFLEYMRETAVVWEMLAFVKLRAVGGDVGFGRKVEAETRQTIHDRAVSTDTEELRTETLRVRQALEKQRVRSKRIHEIDIKYGAGGMLDVYFSMRYLQLRDNVPDEGEDRSTAYMLDRLKERGSLTADIHDELKAGYQFLATLDHNLRLTIGRTTLVRVGSQAAIATIVSRMGYRTTAGLIEDLTMHRLAIRSAFEAILG